MLELLWRVLVGTHPSTQVPRIPNSLPAHPERYTVLQAKLADLEQKSMREYPHILLGLEEGQWHEANPEPQGLQ